MQHPNLPTEDLRNYGIIKEDLTFSEKLSPEDVQKFLRGYTIVADNGRNRATFQLTHNNTQLKVIFLERDKSLSEILEQSRERVQYMDIKNLSKSPADWNIEKKVFIFDKENGKTVEFDLIKNAAELTAIIADQKNVQELKRYKAELEKMKNYLYDKMDQYPEIAKDIANDLNIVDKHISSVYAISNTEQQADNHYPNSVQLDVNDPDGYEDANRHREEEQEEELQRPKGRGR